MNTSIASTCLAFLCSLIILPAATAGQTNEGKPKVEAVRKAAESGDAHAMTQLGLRYQLGDGVKQDWTEAEKWYLKAANLGDGEAMSMLGTCYEYKFRLRIAQEAEAQGLTRPNLGNSDKAKELVLAMD